jgi:hypothetical protein
MVALSDHCSLQTPSSPKIHPKTPIAMGALATILVESNSTVYCGQCVPICRPGGSLHQSKLSPSLSSTLGKQILQRLWHLPTIE